MPEPFINPARFLDTLHQASQAHTDFRKEVLTLDLPGQQTRRFQISALATVHTHLPRVIPELARRYHAHSLHSAICNSVDILQGKTGPTLRLPAFSEMIEDVRHFQDLNDGTFRINYTGVLLLELPDGTLFGGAHAAVTRTVSGNVLDSAVPGATARLAVATELGLTDGALVQYVFADTTGVTLGLPGDLTL